MMRALIPRSPYSQWEENLHGFDFPVQFPHHMYNPIIVQWVINTPTGQSLKEKYRRFTISAHSISKNNPNCLFMSPSYHVRPRKKSLVNSLNLSRGILSIHGLRRSFPCLKCFLLRTFQYYGKMIKKNSTNFFAKVVKLKKNQNLAPISVSSTKEAWGHVFLRKALQETANSVLKPLTLRY